MKKLFTLAAAVLACFSLSWAEDPTLPADATPSTTLDASTLDETVRCITNAVHNGKQYYVYSFDTIRTEMKAGNVTWIKGPKNDGGNSSGTISFASDDAELNYGFTTAGTRAWGINNARYVGIRVNNCSEFAALTKSNSTKDGKTLYIHVFKKNGETWNFVESLGTETYNNSKYYVLSAILDAAEEYVILLTSGYSSNCLTAQIRFASPYCQDPEFTVSPTEGTGFVDDQIDITVSSKNQSKPINSAVTVDGVAGVYGTDYTFSVSTGLVQATPLKAGTFEITFSQASNGTYCDAAKTVTFVISEKTPVTTVTVDGPTAGVIGQELTYTATAEGATAYQWLVDGIDANTNAATFKYTAVKGNHSIVCKARNQFNVQNEEETWVESAPIALTVTKLCGELIKATHTAGKTADVTGVVGGTTDKNTANDGKFGGKGQYFGITLANGTFMVGDEINVHTTTAAGQGTLAFYADKNGSTLIYDTKSAGVAGDNQVVLTNTFAGKSTIYVCRTEGNTWNGYVDYISVTRSCEDSNDASIASLTINGEKVEENDGVFAYTVSAKENLAQVAVVYAIHPMATATPASGFNVTVPAAGDPANTQVITVTAEDGTTQKAYTVSVTKSASLSNDATLKALSVEGFELTPAFDPAVTAYTITKAYSAELPAVGLVTATTNDANATANVAYNELVANEILVQVLAEDGETAKTYSITVLSAAAKKDMLEASFSNGANGYIKDGNIKVPYLNGTAEPEFVAAKFWKADGEPSAAVVDGQLVVTGIDESVEKYTIEYVAVTPMEASYELITFTEVPSYIYSIYGWDESKGIKFSKDVEEASKKRISEGQDRIYIALPAAESVILTGGSTGARPIKVTVNGVVDEKVTSTPKSGETVTIELSQSSANFVGIESNGNSGDAGFTKMQLVKGTATSIDNTEDAVKAVKVIRNGQLFIEKNGKTYNALGAEVK